MFSVRRSYGSKISVRRNSDRVQIGSPSEVAPILLGLKVQDLRKNVDERGFFAEILREDWKDLLGVDKIVQANLSYSYPGMIRPWHRHSWGQVDYFIVLEGSMKICAYDDQNGSPRKGQIDEVVASGETPGSKARPLLARHQNGG